MLDIRVTYQGNWALISVQGAMHSQNALEFGAAIGKEVDAGHFNMVLDLSQTTMVASAGLRELVNALKRVNRLGGQLCVQDASERVMLVLEMAGLDALLKCEDDLG